MEINPLGILLALVIIYLLFFAISALVIYLLYRLNIVKITSLQNRMILAFFAAIVLMVAAYYWKQASVVNNSDPVTIQTSPN
jgi:hypothetical protein